MAGRFSSHVRGLLLWSEDVTFIEHMQSVQNTLDMPKLIHLHTCYT